MAAKFAINLLSRAKFGRREVGLAPETLTLIDLTLWLGLCRRYPLDSKRWRSVNEEYCSQEIQSDENFIPVPIIVCSGHENDVKLRHVWIIIGPCQEIDQICCVTSPPSQRYLYCTHPLKQAIDQS